MRRRLAGVRIRVTLAAVLVVGVALLAGGALLVVVYRHAITDDVEAAARLRARDVADALQGGGLRASIADSGGDDSVVQVVDRAGTVVASSGNVEGEAPFSSLRPGPGGVAAATTSKVPVGDSSFRVVARRVATDDGTYVVYVARSLESVDDNTESLVQLLAIGYPLLLLLVGVTTWIVAGRALRPVETIRREVEEINVSDLHRRVPEPDADDEVGRLARTMNGMLGRLEEATERQRRFVSDASHELRSPLAGIRAQLEVDLAHPDLADWQATERDVLDDAVRMQRLVEDLLAIAVATSPGGQAAREPVDLDDVVLREARRVRARSDRAIDTSAVSGAQLVGDADALARAVRNLLDNAVRHARSTVQVILVESADDVTLCVTDDGPGIPLEDHDRIFEPFTRLDEARTRDAGGSGLGLAITAAVVHGHAGTIEVDNVPGARFTIRIPR